MAGEGRLGGENVLIPSRQVCAGWWGGGVRPAEAVVVLGGEVRLNGEGDQAEAVVVVAVVVVPQGVLGLGERPGSLPHRGGPAAPLAGRHPVCAASVADHLPGGPHCLPAGVRAPAP